MWGVHKEREQNQGLCYNLKIILKLTFLPPLHQKSPTPVSVPAKQHNRGSAQGILSYSKTTVAYPVSVCIFS